MTKPEAAEIWYKKYLDNYIKSVKVERRLNDCVIWISLIDSSAFGIRFTTKSGSSFDVYFYPNSKINMVNGSYNGYKCGKDYFTFNYIPGKGFLPYNFSYNKNRNRNELVRSCKNSPNSCTTLIMLDGWEIRDDYPFKF